MTDAIHQSRAAGAPAAAQGPVVTGVAAAPLGAAIQPIPPASGGTLVSRLVWLVLFAAPAGVITLAGFLTPNPIGHGTHVQLGLPPCGFYVVTGMPCPGCGLTTSFAYMTRADVVGAALANPFGVMLFIVSATTALIAFLGMVRGWPVIQTLDRLQADKWAMLLAISSLTVWTVKIVTMLAGL